MQSENAEDSPNADKIGQNVEELAWSCESLSCKADTALL